MKNLGGRVAFITGGASGIGLGIARVFLRAGIRVVIADVSREHLDDAASQLAPEAVPRFKSGSRPSNKNGNSPRIEWPSQSSTRACCTRKRSSSPRKAS